MKKIGRWKKIAILSFTTILMGNSIGLSFMHGGTFVTHATETKYGVTAQKLEWAKGEIGQNLGAELVDNTLTIMGEGDMYDFESILSLPWSEHMGEIVNVVIEEGVTSVSDRAFFNCYEILSVSFPESIERIGQSAFVNCLSLREVSLPKGVRTVGQYAWQGCTALKEVYLPNTLRELGYSAFAECTALEKIEVTAGNGRYCSDNGVLFNGEKTALLHYPAAKTEEQYAIPQTVKTIGDHAFQHATSLTQITLPNGLTEVGEYAFQHCAALKGVQLPGSVRELGGHAFEFCEGLTSLILPEGMVKVGGFAFNGCINMESLVVPSSMERICAYAFFDCPALQTVYYGGKDFFEWNTIKKEGLSIRLLTAERFYYSKDMPDYTGNYWHWTSENTPEVWDIGGEEVVFVNRAINRIIQFLQDVVYEYFQVKVLTGQSRSIL